ncbi:MAG: DUF1320 domain-containing protein [Rhodoferax sp.]|nr:DUF1320 domain-containing protein [Rhodoferax sp.]MDP3652422.1 DUF1320 domain-containing protein [Rhodoferax sp.]
MTYATQSDLVDRFGEAELAQRTNRVDGLTIDTAVLGRALADADAEIDSYLTKRYALPLASTPLVLTRLACDITRYRLFDDGTPETVRLRYEDAVSLLRRFSSGDVQLAGVAAAAVAGVDTAHHAFAPRQMTDDSLRGFA